MKCKYYKLCPLYSEVNVTCEEHGGDYGDSKAGCYDKMKEKHG